MGRSSHAYPVPRWTADDLRVVVIDDYLPAAEASEMLEFAIASAYEVASTIPRTRNEPLVDAGYRRGWVSYPTAEPIPSLAARLLAEVSRRMDGGKPVEYSTELDLHLIASRDGDYFRPHTDNDHALLRARRYTYAYYLHRRPRRFGGGELLIYPGADFRCVRSGPIHRIEPLHNRLVIFPSALMHESLPVRAPGVPFEDSRFSIVGWVSEKG